jgi:hypothetical protein
LNLSDPQFTAEFWGWAARLASGAGIIGGAAGVAALVIAWFQLRHIQQDQKRIADELTKGPRLVLRVLPAAPESTNEYPVALAHPNWGAGNPISDPLELSLNIGNVGERTARAIRCNFWFPSVVKQVKIASQDVQHPPAGVYVITKAEDAHPAINLEFRMALFVERTDAFEGVVTASLDDRPAYTWKFRVLLE